LGVPIGMGTARQGLAKGLEAVSGASSKRTDARGPT
jgi:hypothetical protein